MHYMLTWLPEENAFRIRRADGEVAYIQAPVFRKLVRSAGRLRRLTDEAVRKAGEPVGFEFGPPPECAENYQRSLVRSGTEDSRSLHNCPR